MFSRTSFICSPCCAASPACLSRCEFQPAVAQRISRSGSMTVTGCPAGRRAAGTSFGPSAEERVIEDVEPAAVGLTAQDLGGGGGDRFGLRCGCGEGRGGRHQGEVIDAADVARFERY